MNWGDVFIISLLIVGAATHVVIFALGMQELAERISLWRLKRTLARKRPMPRVLYDTDHPYDVRGK